MKLTNWYEVRADYRKVATFASHKEARSVVRDWSTDLYKDKVMQIVLCRNRTLASRLFGFMEEEVVYETHPTVLELDLLLADLQKDDFKI